MPAKSYFVMVEFEVMGDSAEEAERTIQTACDIVGESAGDVLDSQIKDVEENAPLDEEIG